MYSAKSTNIRRLLYSALIAMCVFGCQSNKICPPNLSCEGCDPTELNPNLGGPAYLSLPDEPCISDCGPIDTAFSPLDISDYASIQYNNLTLQECIHSALNNSKVFRDLGGTLISNPQVIDGVYDPSLVYTDPQFSEEAALSEFDANFTTAAFFQNNDQASNLTFQGNNGIFEQDFHDYRSSIQKLSATGTIFTLSNIVNYDNSNQTGQSLSHSWQTIFQGEFRHPLLQGSGTLFNRIAGPSTQPGVFGGVLIARTNTEISLSQFNEGVRDLVSEVENAYWDLYFAYRNLEATIDGRDKAYEILVATTEGQAREGTQAQAQAKEQYLRFERDVLDAMEGRPTFGTRNNNGMSGGVFLSPGGVRVTERRLRLICGMPINSDRLLRTADEPASTGIQFDWHQSVDEAFSQRQELLQQRWLVKQRELQLVASKNFLKPRLDFIGQYRFRGLGRSLTGNPGSFQDDLNNGTSNSSAFGDLYSGDFQEWQVGAEFSLPLGFRAAHLGVRNAELALSRERTILQEQKREVMFGLSNAFGELRRTYAGLKASEEQYVAAREFQYVMRLEVERGRDRDIELEAQRRVVDAEIVYRQSQVEYMLALKNVHFEKGTYLQFCNVRLSESASDPRAELDASARVARRGEQISYVTDSPTIAQPKSPTNFIFQQSHPQLAPEFAEPIPAESSNSVFTFPENEADLQQEVFDPVDEAPVQEETLDQLEFEPQPPVENLEDEGLTFNFQSAVPVTPTNSAYTKSNSLMKKPKSKNGNSILKPLSSVDSIPSSRRINPMKNETKLVGFSKSEIPASTKPVVQPSNAKPLQYEMKSEGPKTSRRTQKK